jgi:hypothetical protein
VKLLSKQTQFLQLNWLGSPTNTWSSLQAGGDYQELSMTSNNVQLLSNKGYFDLAGMSMEQKTLFIQNISLQFQSPPSATDGVQGDAVEIITMLSDVPIEQQDISGPGWYPSTMSSDNCFLRRVQTWAIDTGQMTFGNYFRLVNETVDGMAESTTSDRIYYAVYVRLIVLKIGPAEVSPMTSLTIPGIRFVIEADAKEEPEFVYLMRQRRAYELQQEPDVD